PYRFAHPRTARGHRSEPGTRRSAGRLKFATSDVVENQKGCLERSEHWGADAPRLAQEKKPMHETIPWLDLTRQYRQLRSNMVPVVDDLMSKSNFILGPAVERFEADFARFVGARYCVGLNSGTSALQLALLACDIAPGDEVITVPATWISTCWAISYVQARPVFVDIEPHTYCMDPARIEEAITPQTRAILPVHLYGQVADMPAINAIAQRHGLAVIEDACQAHAATLNCR